MLVILQTSFSMSNMLNFSRGRKTGLRGLLNRARPSLHLSPLLFIQLRTTPQEILKMKITLWPSSSSPSWMLPPLRAPWHLLSRSSRSSHLLFEYGDFRKSLPRKLAVGFSLLFISVITTMISFGTAIFLVIRFEKKVWTNTLIYTAAFFPVCVFALTQFPLYSAFIKTLQTLFKKIVKEVNPRKLIPRYLRTSKSKTCWDLMWEVSWE